MSQKLEQIKGFKILPIGIEEGPFKRYLYFRSQQIKSPQILTKPQNENDQTKNQKKDKRQTIFVLNLWPNCSHEELKEIFSLFGEIERIDFFNENQSNSLQPHPSPTQVVGPFSHLQNQNPDQGSFQKLPSYSSAQIVYFDSESVNKALEATLEQIEELKSRNTGIQTINPDVEEIKKKQGTKEPESLIEPRKNGINKWLHNYELKRKDAYLLSKSINKFLQTFDEEQRIAQQILQAKIQKLSSQPDEDGFVLVTHKKTNQKNNLINDFNNNLTNNNLTVADNPLVSVLGSKNLSPSDVINIQKTLWLSSNRNNEGNEGFNSGSNSLMSWNNRGSEKTRQELKKEKKRKRLQEFYKFQKKEKEKIHLLELRKRFEEDKQKLLKMKQQRRFNPY